MCMHAEHIYTPRAASALIWELQEQHNVMHVPTYARPVVRMSRKHMAYDRWQYRQTTDKIDYFTPCAYARGNERVTSTLLRLPELHSIWDAVCDNHNTSYHGMYLP